MALAIAATATATATAAAATTTSRALLARPCFIDRQRASLKILLVEHGNRFARLLLGSHFDESEPTRSACRAILHDINSNHYTRLGEVILEVILGCGEGKIPYE